MNTVVIIGNLSREVNLHDDEGKTPFCNLNVAVNDRVKNPQTGEYEDRPSFIPVKVFGRQAENCARYLSKGRKVAVRGKIQTGSYEKQDGTRVYTTDVVAQEVEFLSPASENHDKPIDRLSEKYSYQESTLGPAGELPKGFHEVDDECPF